MILNPVISDKELAAMDPVVRDCVGLIWETVVYWIGASLKPWTALPGLETWGKVVMHYVKDWHLEHDITTPRQLPDIIERLRPRGI